MTAPKPLLTLRLLAPALAAHLAAQRFLAKD